LLPHWEQYLYDFAAAVEQAECVASCQLQLQLAHLQARQQYRQVGQPSQQAIARRAVGFGEGGFSRKFSSEGLAGGDVGLQFEDLLCLLVTQRVQLQHTGAHQPGLRFDLHGDIGNSAKTYFAVYPGLDIQTGCFPPPGRTSAQRIDRVLLQALHHQAEQLRQFRRPTVIAGWLGDLVGHCGWPVAADVHFLGEQRWKHVPLQPGDQCNLQVLVCRQFIDCFQCRKRRWYR